MRLTENYKFIKIHPDVGKKVEFRVRMVEDNSECAIYFKSDKKFIRACDHELKTQDMETFLDKISKRRSWCPECEKVLKDKIKNIAKKLPVKNENEEPKFNSENGTLQEPDQYESNEDSDFLLNSEDDTVDFIDENPELEANEKCGFSQTDQTNNIYESHKKNISEAYSMQDHVLQSIVETRNQEYELCKENWNLVEYCLSDNSQIITEDPLKGDGSNKFKIINSKNQFYGPNNLPLLSEKTQTSNLGASFICIYQTLEPTNSFGFISPSLIPVENVYHNTSQGTKRVTECSKFKPFLPVGFVNGVPSRKFFDQCGFFSNEQNPLRSFEEDFLRSSIKDPKLFIKLNLFGVDHFVDTNAISGSFIMNIRHNPKFPNSSYDDEFTRDYEVLSRMSRNELCDPIIGTPVRWRKFFSNVSLLGSKITPHSLICSGDEITLDYKDDRSSIEGPIFPSWNLIGCPEDLLKLMFFIYDEPVKYYSQIPPKKLSPINMLARSHILVMSKKEFKIIKNQKTAPLEYQVTKILPTEDCLSFEKLNDRDYVIKKFRNPILKSDNIQCIYYIFDNRFNAHYCIAVINGEDPLILEFKAKYTKNITLSETQVESIYSLEAENIIDVSPDNNNNNNNTNVQKRNPYVNMTSKSLKTRLFSLYKTSIEEFKTYLIICIKNVNVKFNNELPEQNSGNKSLHVIDLKNIILMIQSLGEETSDLLFESLIRFNQLRSISRVFGDHNSRCPIGSIISFVPKSESEMKIKFELLNKFLKTEISQILPKSIENIKISLNPSLVKQDKTEIDENPDKFENINALATLLFEVNDSGIKPTPLRNLDVSLLLAILSALKIDPCTIPEFEGKIKSLFIDVFEGCKGDPGQLVSAFFEIFPFETIIRNLKTQGKFMGSGKSKAEETTQLVVKKMKIENGD